MSGTRYAQFCGLARATEVIGERWTLLIVRELLLGPRRFSDLGARLAGMSPSLLVARLNTLVESGVVRRATLAAPFNAQVYELTEIGQALRPAIRELIRWGGHFLFPMRAGDAFEPDWVLLALDAIARRRRAPACRIALRIRHGKKSATVLVQGGAHGTMVTAGEPAGAVTIETGFDTLLRILAREISLDDAIAARQVVLEGSAAVAQKLPDLFDLGGGAGKRQR